MMPIVVDIWGGPGSCEFLARYWRPVEEALGIAKAELAAGYLVNLRMDASFGPLDEFDLRTTSEIGRPIH